MADPARGTSAPVDGPEALLQLALARSMAMAVQNAVGFAHSVQVLSLAAITEGLASKTAEGTERAENALDLVSRANQQVHEALALAEKLFDRQVATDGGVTTLPDDPPGSD